MFAKISLANIGLKVNNLDATREFYSVLLEVDEMKYDKEEKILAYSLGNTTLRFIELSNYNENNEYTKGISFIGLELGTFEQVDNLHEKLIKLKPEIIFRDVRTTYKNQIGPYGFFIKDPDGYILKIHKYNSTANKSVNETGAKEQ